MYPAIHLGQEIRNYWVAFTRLTYPTTCPLCEKRLDVDEDYLCRHCFDSIPFLRQPLCPKCAMELPPFLTPSRCPSCERITTYYTRGASVFPYTEEIKQILHRIKFGQEPWYLKALRTHIEQTKLPLPIEQYHLLVPIPLDRSRARKREYNQSALIAQLLITGRKNAPRVAAILKKTRKTEPQSALDRAGRLINLEQAFQLKRWADVKNKTILLVDDVVTTGATVNECAKCLIEGGAARVDFFSVARTISQ